MKRSRCLLLVLLLVTLPLAAQITRRPVNYDDIFAMKTISGVEISPDGRRAAFVSSQPELEDNLYRTHIYMADLATGAVLKLTNGPKQDASPRWSPDGKWIAFLSDRPAKPEKAGKRQVWLISVEGGEALQLTRGTFTVSQVEWAPDGKSIAFVATEAPPETEEKRKKDKDDAEQADKNLRMGRIYIAGVPDGEAKLLYAGERHITSISFSPRGDEIAFADQPTPKVPDAFYSVVRVISVADQKVRELAGGELTNSDPEFSPDGKYIAFQGGSQKDWAANNYVYVVPAAGGVAQNITKDYDEEVGQFRWAADSSAIYFNAANKTARHILKATLDGKVTPVYAPSGVARDVAVARDTIAFVYEDPNTPPDLYVGALSAPPAPPAKRGKQSAAATTFQFTPRKITSLNPQVAQLALGTTEVIRWKNKQDGVEIEGLLLTPPNYANDKPLPLLLVIHGGPAGVFSSSFTVRRGAYPVQIFAGQGYAVLMPNPRGSGGYGEKFRKLNVKDWGGGDYNDIQDGVDYLIGRGIADKERMGVMGWSYGGYMTSWTITRTARFKAASVGAGVTNLFSFYGTADIPPFIESYFGAKPWEDRELMARHSAMYWMDRVNTPTLIQHGTEDRRVPIEQGEQLYTALRARNVPTEFFRYPRSEHGITEPKLQRDTMMRNVEWFDYYVRGNQHAAVWHKGIPATGETQAVAKED